MFLKASALAAGCLVALMSFDDAGAVPASPSLLKHPSLVIEIAGRLRTRLASWPLGRLPAQLGSLGPTLLVPANALGPLVIAAKMENPAPWDFRCPAMAGAGIPLRGIAWPILCVSARKASESFSGHQLYHTRISLLHF